ncbi:MAG: hypothetical protein A2X87_00680 [Deltaproteobacteria bacterium GWC2_42_51]|nr:MAG: hypothetical protein A2X87_00680 [Deltaproteobacteria bacterium GWC2_42_51]OGP43412.1 MAG: hypothetical protein A2090_04105 [Deltaproteobacteria bacterium GWD2_42_10]OGP46151.1 MAG: hypothetical protein A2022_01135 [Deltaproteobacteria bacterium GWF2_42_12]OGQ66567.1 MAG: hypothetical protein A3F88_05415 [Deltaproteobacteria bacterium RIFCSPLOWO2_12_FULL_42_16]OGQ76838.1 MAG: hypothetical protein A2235_01615 [Deltaproteobacteria bacterium RIFOXYA2_FULL_42_10]HCY18565.1 hypothetical pro
MKILVIGTPKRDFSIGFDTAILGLSRAGIDFDHYPNILARSYGHTGTYQLRFDTDRISYPEYHVIEGNIKKGLYDLIITTVCRVDYNAGKHGIFSKAVRRLKYSLKSNKYKLGGMLVLDWLRKGIDLPPIVVVDDLDDPFIHPPDFGLLANCAVYFKRELPFNRFLCFRLRLGFSNDELMSFANKLRPVWTSYDRESISAFTMMDDITLYEERDIDILFLGSTYASYGRQLILPILRRLGKRYRVISPESGRRPKEEFYKLLKRSRICVSPEGRGWDTPKHYELPLFGGLLFLPRPTIELAIDFKDGENCVFVDNHFRDFERLADYYLANPAISAEIARNGYQLARNRLGNDRLAEYVLQTTKEAIGK